MKTYEYHELASLLPLLDDEDFDALVEDIREYGQIEPITLFEGKILDGRNRYKACLELGIEVKTKEWTPSELNGLTPLQYVISENIMRRHLNVAQRSEIALLLLPEIEAEAEKRKEETVGRPKKSEINKFQKKEERNPQSTKIAGKKVKVSQNIMMQAKRVQQVAETEPLIKEEWEKAKKGEQGVDAVYQKAKIIEDIKTLPKKDQNGIKKMISTESASKVKEAVEEAKEEQQRREDAQKYREMQKQKEEMNRLLKTIESTKNKIEDAKQGIKQSEAQLDLLSEEVISKYPQWSNKDPSYVLTQLSLLYDSLDTKIFNDQLKVLREEYDAQIRPLREQIKRLEAEFDSKKQEITKSKNKIETEIKTIERYEDLFNKEFETIEDHEESISQNGEVLKNLLRDYDAKYK